MDIFTNQQSLQVYTCDTQPGTIPLKTSQRNEFGENVQKYGCVVVEHQGWIDGVNHPEWGRDRYQIFGPETGPFSYYTRHEFGVLGS